MMPHDRRRAEPQCPTALPQPPAHIDVIPGGAISGIESADGFKRGLAHRYVTAWNMIGFLVGQEDMDWIARRVGDTIGHESIAGG